MAKKNRKKAGKKGNLVALRTTKRGDAYQDAVALVAKSIAPSAEIEVGAWIDGPDGRRDLDVAIRSSGDDSTLLAVIECKDWNKPIGIAFIDALDSKRRDIGAPVAMICSNSGFTADALRKAARLEIPALAALIEGDKRIRVVVREQTYTPIVEFVHHQPFFHYPYVTEEARRALMEPAYTMEWTYGGKSLEAWVAAKLLGISGYATHSRSFVAKFRFRQPMFLDFRGLKILVNGIDIRAAFTVQWMTQVVEIGASQGMYDYLHKRVILGSGHQFHLKNVNSQTWGKPVGIEEVPPHLLAPINLRPRPEMPSMSMTLRMIKNLPQSEAKDAPDIDQFIISEEIVDENP